MNKNQLQKELLEKVKKGIKPSDLKKKKPNPLDLSTNPTKEPKSKENLTNNPPLSPYEDEGYFSDNQSNKSLNNKNNLNNNKNSLNKSELKKVQQLEQERNFEAKKAQNYLEQITKLTAELDSANLEIKGLKRIKPTKTQTELEKALKEANQKIRVLEEEKKKQTQHLLEKHNPYQKRTELLEKQNKQLLEKISNLEKPTKNKQILKEEKKFYLFTCDVCQANKKSQLHRERINGLGFDPHQYYKICDGCLQKVDVITPQEAAKDFFGF
jgi:hypothetical protein